MSISAQADHGHSLQGMKKAAEKYRQAMKDEKSRNQWIENYLPLVKSIVSRLRHHFPESYETEDMYGIGARALVVAVNKFDSSVQILVEISDTMPKQSEMC